MSNEFEETYFDEPAPPPRKPEGPKRSWNAGAMKARLPWLAAAAVLVVAIVLVVYFVAIRNTSSTNTSTGTTTNQALGHYKVTYPKSWAPVSPDSVAPGQNAFAAFREKAGNAVVVMRLEGGVKTINTAYLNSLKSQLQRTVSDYKFVSSHVIPLQPGQALDFTYERTTLHQVRNVVVLPVGKVSVVMATIAPVGDAAVTRQINQIVSSFTLSSS